MSRRLVVGVLALIGVILTALGGLGGVALKARLDRDAENRKNAREDTLEQVKLRKTIASVLDVVDRDLDALINRIAVIAAAIDAGSGADVRDYGELLKIARDLHTPIARVRCAIERYGEVEILDALANDTPLLRRWKLVRAIETTYMDATQIAQCPPQLSYRPLDAVSKRDRAAAPGIYENQHLNPDVFLTAFVGTDGIRPHGKLYDAIRSGNAEASRSLEECRRLLRAPHDLPVFARVLAAVALLAQAAHVLRKGTVAEPERVVLPPVAALQGACFQAGLPPARSYLRTFVVPSLDQ